jgi:hypothetical protein
METPTVTGKVAGVPQNDPAPLLNLISTLWSVVVRAHHGSALEAQAARQQLLERYGGAVYRYLSKLLQDPDAVDEVYQEFALTVIRGQLKGADPQRGRFRNFVKGTLIHLVGDYRRKQKGWPRPLPDEAAALAAEPQEMESDRLFVESWRDELLARSWAALADVETRTGRPYHTVLRFRADHPDVPSPQMAEQLSAKAGMLYNAVAVRQILHRARDQFADLLLDEVAQSLANPSVDQVERELLDIGLFEYCRPALERRPCRGDDRDRLSRDAVVPPSHTRRLETK